MTKKLAHVPSARMPRMRILLVDDNKDDYVLACHLLAQVDANKSPRTRFDLEWVATYEAALEAIEQAQHHVYLVDYCLGNQDGLDLLRTAIAGGCQAPIIILTGQGDQTVDVTAMQAGAADYLVKDRLSPELLERSLRYAIERKRTEQELQRYRDQLEELVRERTAELEKEIAERKRVEDLIHVQRDLALALSGATELDETLRLCVEAAIHIARMDCGGVYLVDEISEDLDLAFAKGLSPDFVKHVSHIEADSASARLIMTGKTTYTAYQKLSVPIDEPRRREGLRAIAIIPVHHEEQIIACLNIASHSLDEIPFTARDALETVAAQIGSAIARAKAEEALRESEEKYRMLFNSSPESITLVGLDGVVLECNDPTTSVAGLSRQEMIGKPFTELAVLSAQDIPKYAELFARLATGQPVGPLELEVTRSNNQIRWLESFPALLKKDGEFSAIQVITRDITERKKAKEALIHNLKERLAIEETLRQRNRELALLHQANQALTSTLDLDQVLVTVLEEVRNVLDAAACSVWLIDPQTDELVCQQATGSQSEIVRGWRLAPGEGLAGWVAHSGESLIVPDAYADERYFRGMDQQTKLSLRSILSVPLRVKQKVIGVLQVVDTEVDRFDETHLTLLEPLSMAAAVAIENARLYEETDRLRAFNENIVQSMQEGIVLYDTTGHITFANPRTAELLGYAPHELVGLHWKDCVAPEHVAQTEQEVAKWTQGIISRFESEWLTQDGHHVPVIVSAHPLFDKGHLSSVLVALTDITERKQAEERIKATLQEKEVLLKEIHHRVKNNLQVISSLLDLQSDHILDEQALRMFEDSRNRVRSMALIHERLYQSRDLARIDFAAYIQALASYLFRSYNIDSSIITLETAVDDVSLDVSAAIPCGLIISELVSNALKHAFPAGKRGTIHVVLCADDDRLVLTVGDDGIGLPQNLDWRNTESLGLRLVNMLAKQLEGTIELDRSDGTAFTITFPAQG